MSFSHYDGDRSEYGDEVYDPRLAWDQQVKAHHATKTPDQRERHLWQVFRKVFGDEADFVLEMIRDKPRR